jgi:hypothetical protein
MTDYFDEMLGDSGADDAVNMRGPYQDYGHWFDREDPNRIHRKAVQAEGFFRKTGITFNVYGTDEGDERLIPFDVVPRILSAPEWRKLSRGIEQRVRALNAFLHDIYHRQEIVRAGRVPVELIANNAAFLPHPGAAGQQLSGQPAALAGRLRAACLRWQAGGGGADAGYSQFGLLRAQLPGRSNGLGAGRRTRFARGRWADRDAHDARLYRDRRALPAGRR